MATKKIPHRFRVGDVIMTGAGTITEVKAIVQCKSDLICSSLVDGFRVGVFKQNSKVEIFVKPSDLWIHKGKVQQVVKVLYGKD